MHPTKTEVKFMEEKKVFDAVYHAALAAIQKENLLSTPAAPTDAAKISESDSVPAFRSSGTPARPETFRPRYEDSPARSYRSNTAPRDEAPVPFAFSGGSAAEQTSLDGFGATRPQPSGASDPEPQTKKSSSEVPPFRMIGEVMNTYILVQQDEKLIIIDKHACHERIIFDRLLTEDRSVMSQILMVPVTVKTDEETATLLEENGELLTDLGFELEPYGDNSHIIRAVPADMYESDVTAAFEEICQQLKDHRTVDLEARKTNILKTVACKAAIKAGWKTDVRELFVLAEAVVSQKIKYCPHGRPVAVVYTREDLDKEFKRIV